MAKIIGACVKNDKGQLLPYTMASTMSQCEENAEKLFPGYWDRLQKLGCKVVQVTISEVGESNEQAKTDG